MRSIRRYQFWDRVDVVRRHLNLAARPRSLRKLLRAPALEWSMRTARTSACPLPLMVKVEPTNACNLRCVGCYSHHTTSWTGEEIPARPRGFMSLEVFRRIVDQLASSVYKISLYGQGEPLLHKGLPQMVEYAARSGVSCVVSSNLTTLSDGMIDALLDCGLEQAIVAVDTLDPERYAAYRVGGDLGRVLENLARLIEHKRRWGRRFPIIEVQSILRADNQDEAEALRRFSRTIGADRYSAKLDSEFLKTLPAERQAGRKCYWLWYSAAFNWDGTVSPCGCALVSPDFVYGDITREAFSDIWNTDKYRRSRMLFSRRAPPDVAGIPECYSCPIFPNSHFRAVQDVRGAGP